MNPVLFSAAAEAAADPSIMEYVKILGSFVVAVYMINKIGDLKMILYVLVVVGAFVVFVYGVPGMENTAVYPLVVEFIENLPSLIEELKSKAGGII